MVKTLFCSGALVALLVALPGRAEATTYEVGPGKTYANIGNVPLEALTAGRHGADLLPRHAVQGKVRDWPP